jgi:hypothetical protein
MAASRDVGADLSLAPLSAGLTRHILTTRLLIEQSRLVMARVKDRLAAVHALLREQGHAVGGDRDGE